MDLENRSNTADDMVQCTISCSIRVSIAWSVYGTCLCQSLQHGNSGKQSNSLIHPSSQMVKTQKMGQQTFLGSNPVVQTGKCLPYPHIYDKYCHKLKLGWGWIQHFGMPKWQTLAYLEAYLQWLNYVNNPYNQLGMSSTKKGRK